jgi:hypothetical protein
VNPGRILCLVLALAALARGQENLFIHAPKATYKGDRTRIEATALFSVAAPTGYLPVRVTVNNERTSDGVVRLSSDSEIGSGTEDAVVSSDFEIACPAGKVTSRDLLLPLVTRYDLRGYLGAGGDLALSGSFGNSRGNFRTQFSPDAPAILMSEPLFTPNSSALDAEINRTASTTTSYGGSSEVFAARFTADQLPDDWRAYSGYDVMILTDEDWLRMAPGARAAVLQWIRLGGRLDLYGPPSRSLASLDLDTLEGLDHANHGLGQTSRVPLAAGSMKMDVTATMKRYVLGYAGMPVNRSIHDDYHRRWPLQESFGKQNFDYAIFIILLIAFGVLVGPVNLFVLAKSGQRHKLFITTPLIALGTCAVLLVLILIRDSLGGRGARLALIEVRPDAGENRAYVVQEQVSRTGVLLGSSFEIDAESAITPVPIQSSPWARLTPGSGGGGMRLDLDVASAGLKVRGDMFQSRSEQGQWLRAVVPTRGRIEIKNSGGPPVLVSSYNFPIDLIYYKDRRGGYWQAGPLAVGEPRTATALPKADYDQAIQKQCERFANRQHVQLANASKRPDHYVALTSSPPTIDTLEAIRWSSDQAVLTGPIAR